MSAWHVNKTRAIINIRSRYWLLGSALLRRRQERLQVFQLSRLGCSIALYCTAGVLLVLHCFGGRSPCTKDQNTKTPHCAMAPLLAWCVAHLWSVLRKQNCSFWAFKTCTHLFLIVDCFSKPFSSTLSSISHSRADKVKSQSFCWDFAKCNTVFNAGHFNQFSFDPYSAAAGFDSATKYNEMLSAMYGGLDAAPCRPLCAAWGGGGTTELVALLQCTLAPLEATLGAPLGHHWHRHKESILYLINSEGRKKYRQSIWTNMGDLG